ncbi:MAG: hypothetical protein DRJ07_06695 [Bacteroidetes bacterium]|nr:MAG: hypothetical protein DRJ07_06695 [Bacteroidota bacterium]
MMDNRKSFLSRITSLLIFGVLFVYVLVEAKQILSPIMLALLFSYFIFPLVVFLETKLKFPRVLAILTSFLLFGIILFTVGNLVVAQIKNFTTDLPALKEQANSNIIAFQNFITDKFGVSIDEQNLWLREKVAGLFETGNKTATNIFLRATWAIEALILIPIFSFFMLTYRERGKNFILMLVKSRNGELTEKLLQQISKVTMKYVGGVISVMFILAISHSVALSIIGVKYAVILALLAASLSIIPYFGTMISLLIPLLFAAVTQDNPYVLLFIILYFWAIIIIDHNILTPTIVGGNVSLNPFITILGIIIAGTVWQISGMIVIVPALAVVKIICDNVEKLKPWGYVLGTDPHKLPVNTLKKIFKQKKKK